MSVRTGLPPAKLVFHIGSRMQLQDYTYAQQLSMYARSAVLQKLFVVFSHDALTTEYVHLQHQTPERAAVV